jgi:hypothetical protein
LATTSMPGSLLRRSLTLVLATVFSIVSNY